MTADINWVNIGALGVAVAVSVWSAHSAHKNKGHSKRSADASGASAKAAEESAKIAREALKYTKERDEHERFEHLVNEATEFLQQGNRKGLKRFFGKYPHLHNTDQGMEILKRAFPASGNSAAHIKPILEEIGMPWSK